MIVRIIKNGIISWGSGQCYEVILNQNPSHEGCIVEVCFTSDDTMTTLEEVTHVINDLVGKNNKIIVTPCKGEFAKFTNRMKLKNAKYYYDLLIKKISSDVVSMPFNNHPLVDIYFNGETHILSVS